MASSPLIPVTVQAPLVRGSATQSWNLTSRTVAELPQTLLIGFRAHRSRSPVLSPSVAWLAKRITQVEPSAAVVRVDSNRKPAMSPTTRVFSGTVP